MEEQRKKRKYTTRSDVLTITAMARLVGVSQQLMYYHVVNGYCPAPTVGGKRKYYSPDQLVDVMTYWIKQGRR